MQREECLVERVEMRRMPKTNSEAVELLKRRAYRLPFGELINIYNFEIATGASVKDAFSTAMKMDRKSINCPSDVKIKTNYVKVDRAIIKEG